MKFIILLCLALSGSVFANEGGGHGGGGGAADLLPIESMVINLSEGHFIQFKPQLKLRDAKEMDLVKAFTPVIRYELIKSLIGKDAAEVQTTKFMAEFSEKAAETINSALHDDYVKELLFDSWLIQ